MFDSPLHDKLPGRLGRFGVPWRGLVEAPSLTDWGTAQGQLRLTTWGGAVIEPFANGQTISYAIGAAVTSTAFRPARAAAHATPEQANGMHFYGATSFNSLGLGEFVDANQELHFGYDSGDSCHGLRLLTSGCRSFAQRVLRRNDGTLSPFSESYVTTPYDPTGVVPTTITMFDVTLDGGQVLCRVNNGYASAAISGNYPNITAKLTLTHPDSEYSTDEVYSERTGEFGDEVVEWRFTALAFGGGIAGSVPAVEIFDQRETATNQGFIYPHQTLATMRRVSPVWTYFKGGQEQAPREVGLLKHERTQRTTVDSQADWGVDGQTITLDPDEGPNSGARVAAHLNQDIYQERHFTAKLATDEGTVAELIMDYARHSFHYRSWVSGSGIYNSDSNSEESIGASGTLSLRLDGVNLLEGWAGLDKLVFDTTLADGFAYNEGVRFAKFLDSETWAPDRRRIRIEVRAYRYTNQLSALAVSLIEERLSGSNPAVIERVETWIGGACHRGMSEPGVTKFNEDFMGVIGATGTPRRLFGSGCPLSGRVTRNSLHPVLYI